MTKLELASAIVNTDSRKNWDESLKQRDIRRLMRHNSKEELRALLDWAIKESKRKG